MLLGRVHLSTMVLTTIALFDLVTSLIWLGQGNAEGNPLFRLLASMGTVPFVLGKVVFLAGPILLLEFARRSHPKSAEQGTWIAAAAYFALYVMHLVQMRS